jgi:hypothetical protein
MRSEAIFVASSILLAAARPIAGSIAAGMERLIQALEDLDGRPRAQLDRVQRSTLQTKMPSYHSHHDVVVLVAESSLSSAFAVCGSSSIASASDAVDKPTITL